MLGQRFVDGDDRIGEGAVTRHRPQTDDTGGRLFSAADDLVQQLPPLLVQSGNEVGAVIHRDLRFVGQGGVNVAIVARIVLAADGEDGDAVSAH